jgi:hypothetical protein
MIRLPVQRRAQGARETSPECLKPNLWRPAMLSVLTSKGPRLEIQLPLLNHKGSKQCRGPIHQREWRTILQRHASLVRPVLIWANAVTNARASIGRLRVLSAVNEARLTSAAKSPQLHRACARRPGIR